MVKKALIIGSGVAGLTAARHLTDAGLAVEVMDKGYRLGGRLATRAKQGYQFDHGTPALDAVDGFEEAVNSGVLVPDGHNGAWYGQPEMRSLCHHLAHGLSVTQALEIDSVMVAGGQVACRLKDGSETDAFDALVCTVPAPQAAKLMAPFEDLVGLAMAAGYAPQWTAMLGFGSDVVTRPQHVSVACDHPVLDRLFYEPAKPGRPHLPAWTLHAGRQWSLENLEQPAEQVLAQMSAALSEFLGEALPTPAYAAAHRWRYARAVKTAGLLEGAISALAPVTVAGDWVGAPDVAGSLASAKIAAQLIMERLEL
ncbi:MAG: NAD(P)/FAD-dependent oxidoreductase [Parvibaculales bacterium]